MQLNNKILELAKKERYSIKELSEKIGMSENGFHKALKTNDFTKKITFHTGRKTFATNYLNQNPEDYVTLSDYLGDTLEQTLKTYAKIVTKTKKDRIAFLDDFKLTRQ